ncbi:MAG: ABC transporter permease subunit [Candidatus Omnitrophica bacterium]|nr:ABC transporter permease subunit [Candidatus Omnitrophota bacterium]
MKRIWILYAQEVKNTFHSLIAYIILAVFMAISSYFFVALVSSFSVLSQQWKSVPNAPQVAFNLTEMVLSALFVNVACLALFFSPILTMRSFSEEKRSGTLELLLTFPIRDHEVIFAKFFSNLTLYFLMILPLLLFPFLIRCVGGYFEWGAVLTGFVGLILLGACFIACGNFVSSLTGNQVISSILSFGILIILWMIGMLETFSDIPQAHWLTNFSIMEHYKSLAKGIVDLKDIAYYVFLTAFFLYATQLSLESRTLKR